MGFLEQKLVGAILTRIRERQEAHSVTDGYVGADPSVSRASVRLREAQFSDLEAVKKLKQRWGLSSDSLENWERLWRRNPALEELQLGRPIGWVLEAGGRVVGYLANISLLYRYGDKTLTAVTGSGLVVEPAYRALSLTLIAAFYRQKSVDLYLTTTAVGTVGKIARAFKSDPLPQQDYDTMLFWVLRPYPFAQALMKKLKLGPTLSCMGSVLVSLAAEADKILHRRLPRRRSTSLAVSEISVQEIGEEFQPLWVEKLNEQPRLLADRSPASLRWHFGNPGDTGTVRIICCRKNGELVGYAVIRNEPPNQVNGLRRSIVADMLAKQDDPAILSALLIAAYDQAKHAGSHVFEMLGFPQNIRKVCSQWHPYRRKYPSSPFYYKAADPTLHKMLSNDTAWYASPFDGDTTLWNFGIAS
jgi:hypothetical protein